MLTAESLATRRDVVEGSPELSMLRDHLVARAAPVLSRMPPVPDVKALLSRDGGVCPDDGAPLVFDPWSPDLHTCSNCGKQFSGERHHAHWARGQHLWLAERAAHLATVHAFTGDEAAASRARELLAAYFDRYFALPNRDNVLGPSHLFFSTYLESIWLLNYLAAAQILRETGVLSDEDIEAVNAIANEAADIIGEFNEGMSNRQTWNAAALTAAGVWFGDEELITTAIESRTGLLGHLADGFGADGMWYEGENYHLFALRGLLLGLDWARAAGAEITDDPRIASHLGAALMAPSLTALPDFTFPSRKDSRYGVSLAHPAYLEGWEVGHAWLGSPAPAGLSDWLTALYAVPARPQSQYDSYLHEAGEPQPHHRTRADLSWWALLTMAPEALPPAASPWRGASRLLQQQGLAVIRRDDTYLSLECGSAGGAHGHPDRLHLTLFSNGVHWFPDPGAGSYVTRDLFWYRSTLAHNAPRLDGVDQASDEPTQCIAFDAKGEWNWAAGKWGDVQRTTVLGPRWIADLVEFKAEDERTLELASHPNGSVNVVTEGTWEPGELQSEFATQVERFVPTSPGPVTLRVTNGEHLLTLWLAGSSELLRALGPGIPGSVGPAPFFVSRTKGRDARMVTVIDLVGYVSGVEMGPARVKVIEAGDSTSIQFAITELVIAAGNKSVTLGGAIPLARPFEPILAEKPLVAKGDAIWTDTPPALDGSLDGFELSAPLTLDGEHQYLRSEEPYPGSEELSAIAFVNWDQSGLYLAVEITKSDVMLRAPDAPPLALDNEPDDINADGIQVYYRGAEDDIVAYLIRPGPGGTLIVRTLAGDDGTRTTLPGKWMRTKEGYRITVALPCSGLENARRNLALPFDLVINEMRPHRVRRAGQLLWNGVPGWVYLRGDRHGLDKLGELELLG